MSGIRDAVAHSAMSPVLTELARVGVIAVLRAPSADAAVDATRALVRGGVTGIEVTYSTPDAATAIARVAAEFADSVLLGAGTLLTPEQADEAVASGARFLVSPGNDKATTAAMKATGRIVMVGALTPTEVMAAARTSDVVKIFPASLGGPAYLRALHGPFPRLPMMPTGGVTVDNVGDWIAAGAVAVGAGGELCPAAAMATGDWKEITDRARAFSQAYRVAAERRAGHHADD